jgi:hypothetical protein
VSKRNKPPQQGSRFTKRCGFSAVSPAISGSGNEKKKKKSKIKDGQDPVPVPVPVPRYARIEYLLRKPSVDRLVNGGPVAWLPERKAT